MRTSREYLELKPDYLLILKSLISILFQLKDFELVVGKIILNESSYLGKILGVQIYLIPIMENTRFVIGKNDAKLYSATYEEWLPYLPKKVK